MHCDIQVAAVYTSWHGTPISNAYVEEPLMLEWQVMVGIVCPVHLLAIMMKYTIRLCLDNRALHDFPLCHMNGSSEDQLATIQAK